MNDQPILTVHNISVYLDQVLALNDISFSLAQGVRLAIVGPNGAGKSTLLNVLAGLIKPAQGQISANSSIAYIPQRALIDWQFPANVADVVMMGRVARIGLFRRASRLDWAKVDEALAQVQLADLATRRIGELSGGQQQRVFLARALAQEADLILLDEPLRGLDGPAQQVLLDILDSLHKQNVTIIIATHNLQVATTCFDQMLLLKQRLLGFGKPADVLVAPLLNEAYGNHFGDHLPI